MKPLRYILLRALLLGHALLLASSALADKQRLELSGYLMLDADYFESFWSGDGDTSSSELALRRVRVQADYDFPKGWLGKLQIEGQADSSGGELDLGSAYLRYTKFKFAELTLGKTKEPVGLEQNTASDSLMTIERSMMSAAFAPGKSWGVHLASANKTRRWALAAVVEDDEDDDYAEATPVAVSGRFTWSPINTAQQTLQVGVSASVRDWNKNIFRIGNRAEVDSADRVVRGAEFIAEAQSLLGLEGFWRRGSLLLQGEFMATRVAEVDGPDWDYHGYYATASYLLTGEQREFRNAGFRSLRPRARSGAWELVARYSYLDVRERGLGSRAAVSTLGLNYYYQRDVKVMLAFLHPEISGSVRHADPDGNAVSLRLQFLF